MATTEDVRTPEPGTQHPRPAPLPIEAQQEIRIAVALNGGVSLAIWMSGVTLELHHLALASAGADRWSTYREVLDLLGATARIDVVAGTSAGGLNGAFLGLALTHGRDLGLLRDVWTTAGSLEMLLRPALEKNPPSLLRGDQHFLPSITEALQKTVDDTKNPQLLSGGAGKDSPIELILTGTLWQGRASSFTDDMGVGITERDHDALFRFRRASGTGEVGNLNEASTVIDQLAAAARCTSSFPGAFEPHWVSSVGSGANGGSVGWASTAGLVNFEESQFVVDGGVLLNKPVRPALEAIYRQTADRQVRRVLAYIVPAPGEEQKQHSTSEPETARPPLTAPLPPMAGDVLLGVLTRLRSSESVAHELAEIRDRNALVRSRRRARAALSQALTSAAGTADALFPAYCDERNRSASATISRLIASGQPRGAGTGAWSEREIAESLGRYAALNGFPFVPQGPDLVVAVSRDGDEWRWGQTTVGRLGDLTVDFLKRVVWLAPIGSDNLETIVAVRAQVANVLEDIREDRRSLNEFWTQVSRGEYVSLDGIPARKGPPTRVRRTLATSTSGSPARCRHGIRPPLPTWTPPQEGTPSKAQRAARAAQRCTSSRCVSRPSSANTGTRSET